MAENEQLDMPNSFEDLQPRHFPLFVTVKQLLYMFDGCNKNSFFEAANSIALAKKSEMRADSRRRKKKKLLVSEKCKKRQPTDSQRSMPSVPSVPLKRVSVKHVRRKLPSVKSNRGKQTSLRLLANANSLNGKQLWQTKPRPKSPSLQFRLAIQLYNWTLNSRSKQTRTFYIRFECKL